MTKRGKAMTPTERAKEIAREVVEKWDGAERVELIALIEAAILSAIRDRARKDKT